MQLKNLLVYFIFLLSLVISSQAFAIKGVPSRIGYLTADIINYDFKENFSEAIGNVNIITDDYHIKANKVLLDNEVKMIWAEGNVVITDKLGRKSVSSRAVFKIEKQSGFVENFGLSLPNNNLVTAKSAIKVDKDLHILDNALYSPCKTCSYRKPIWQVRAKKTEIDFNKQNIKYYQSFFELFGIKILYVPYFSHPLPKAPAVSGLLVPEVKNGRVKIPFYYRAKPNLDMTYTPLISDKSIIHELELRHLLSNGNYNIKGSYNKSKIFTKNNSGEVTNNQNKSRYFVKSDAHFTDNNGIIYDVVAERVSDKSYLKNYYRDYRNSLKSQFWAAKFYDQGYNYVEALNFQGLRQSDDSKNSPYALPNIKIKRYVDIDSGQFEIANSSTKYLEGNKKDIFRNNFDIKFTKFFQTANINNSVTLSDRMDIYSIQKNYYTKVHGNKKSTYYRNIPELSGETKYTQYYYTSNDVAIELGPRASWVIGADKPKNYEKYNLIDSKNIEISEYNIFSQNRFNGFDNHEYGKRLNYGLAAKLKTDNLGADAFLGQVILNERFINLENKDLVGKVGLQLYDNLNTYYRSYKHKKNYKAVRDEFCVEYNDKKINFTNNLVSLNDLDTYRGYYDVEKYNLNSKKLVYNYAYASYKIDENVKLFGDMKIMSSKRKKLDLIGCGLGVEYKYDCVGFTVKMADDLTSDITRNIKKQRSYSFSLGLKSINM